MIIVIAPAKKIDFTLSDKKEYSLLKYPKMVEELVGIMRNMGVEDLKRLMKVSTQLAQLNVARFHNFAFPCTIENGKQSLLSFNGAVFSSIKAIDFNDNDWKFAQEKLKVLSGLYGILRPLDLIQPYRLEMGTKLVTPKGKNLYQYWGDMITVALNEDFKEEGSGLLVNLASKEYFKAIKPKLLKAKIVNIHFKEFRNGQFKVIAIFAKKARGAMVRFIIKNKLTKVEELKAFDLDGYHYDAEMSGENDLVFTAMSH